MKNDPEEKRTEVDWGEQQEPRVVKRWRSVSLYGIQGARVRESESFDDFDYYVFDSRGVLIAYLEIKVRRSPFSRFGDAIFPERKHWFALDRWRENRLPTIAATEYGCGTLVEVDLTREPDRRGFIHRRGREKAVPHVFYERESLTVLEGAVLDGSVS